MSLNTVCVTVIEHCVIEHCVCDCVSKHCVCDCATELYTALLVADRGLGPRVCGDDAADDQLRTHDHDGQLQHLPFFFFLFIHLIVSIKRQKSTS